MKNRGFLPKQCTIVGGGLAGCEAAWFLVNHGIPVVLKEMRPHKMTAAHQTGDLAELVCSNSLKSKLETSAPGELKKEMRAMGSLILSAAETASVDAGMALAVDRKVMSAEIMKALNAHPLFTRVDEEVLQIPSAEELEKQGQVFLVATGPLTATPLAESIREYCGEKQLYFYDAIAPIMSRDSLDESIVFSASRYDDGPGDYLNVPLNKEEYEAFIDAVIAGEKMPLQEFEDPNYFEACLPIEVMIERGRDTLRFGPMKPVGLTDPRTGRWPWAVIQLRSENKDGTCFSLVGFQTKLKWPEQTRIFRTLPGLAEAEILRFGSIHRNTYVKSPQVLNDDLSLKTNPNCYLAGQITGVEGYVESAAIGLVAAQAIVKRSRSEDFIPPPSETMIGALYGHIRGSGSEDFQPMNSNFGILPAMDFGPKKLPKSVRREKAVERAKLAFNHYWPSQCL